MNLTIWNNGNRSVLSSKYVKQIIKLKEFQSLENDVCHTVVFGNVTTVVVSCKMLHWTQMADGSNVF